MYCKECGQVMPMSEKAIIIEMAAKRLDFYWWGNLSGKTTGTTQEDYVGANGDDYRERMKTIRKYLIQFYLKLREADSKQI